MDYRAGEEVERDTFGVVARIAPLRWAIEVRLARGDTPTLDETLRTDIDNHAVEPPERPTVCTLLRPSDETEVPTHASSRPSHRAFGTSVY